MNKVKKYFENELGTYNYSVWRFLYDEMDISQLIEAPEFFKLAQKEFDFFNNNVDSIVKIRQHYEKLRADMNRLYFLLYYLVPLINEKYQDVKGRGSLVFTYDMPALDYIRKLFKEIETAMVKEEEISEPELVPTLVQQTEESIAEKSRLENISAQHPLAYFTSEENINKDFLYELSIAKFPFVKLIKENDTYLSSLKTEFSNLEAKPKLHLFFREFISDEEWRKIHSEQIAELPKSNIANFVAKSAIEIKGEKVIAEFQQKVVSNKVEKKYYGRFIEDTKTIKLLYKFNEQVESFKKYVFEDVNIDNYGAYAKAFAKSILLLASQVTIPGLRLEMLETVVSTSIDTDITLNIFLYQIDETEQRKIKHRFNILKTLTDEIVNDEIQSFGNNIVKPVAIIKGNMPQPEIPPTTVADRVLRELDMITAIFECQYSKYDPDNPNAYPTILDKTGHSGIDGQYIQNIDLTSEVELFNVQNFKEHITQRFESASNHTLLNTQLVEIYEKSQFALKYYNEKLIKGNTLVDDFLKDHNRPVAERIDQLDKYSAFITIYNYHIGSIYLGLDKGSINRESFHISYQPYNYIADNYTLATICENISAFIEKFNLPGIKNDNNSSRKSGSEIDGLDLKLEQLDTKYQVKAIITREEADGQSNGRFKAGMEGYVNPPVPDAPKSAFALFAAYYAARELAVQKSLFVDTYGSLENENAVTAEIKRIEDFITEADKIDYYTACTHLTNPDQHYLFKRLTGGFYQDVRMTAEQLNQNSAAASVYGRYVLFYSYLKSTLERINKDKTYANRTIPGLLKDFYGINGEVNLFSTTPFEIAFIYSYSADDVQRFLTVDYDDLTFLTDFLGYSRFTDRWETEDFYNEDMELLNFESLKPYLKSYRRGFFEGYDQFEENIANQTRVFGNDSQTIANKVFEMIVAPIHGLSVSSSQRIAGKGFKIIKHDLWLESGKELGSNYKAWFYVLNNPQNFVQLFKSHEPFRAFYQSSLVYWKDEPGGEGLTDGLQTVLSSAGISDRPEQATEVQGEQGKNAAKIKSKLAAFENNMDATDFKFLVNALLVYFETGSFPQPPATPMKVSGGVNKKKFGWQLHEIYKLFTDAKLAVPYLQFAKQHISIFQSVDFNEAAMRSSNLYKYFTTKIK